MRFCERALSRVRVTWSWPMTPATRARIHCDLAVVYFAQEKKADADAEFASAVREDPNVAISTDLTTPELRAELASVKASASGHPATTPVAAGASEEV